MLDLHDVNVRYADGTHALVDVTLHVPAGQLCVLLGASGAGKSTLIKVINGLERPTSGEVSVAGRRYVSGERRSGIGTVHQSIDLVPRLSVLDNVLAGALGQVSTLRALLGWFDPKQQRRACELIHRVGLVEEHLYRRASDLSGGQQQRVGVARAFMAEPRLVLADEPVASLDPRTSREILTLLAGAARASGATVVCSLHQVELATEFADRVVGMRAGRIAFDCSPQELRSGLLQTLYAAA